MSYVSIHINPYLHNPETDRTYACSEQFLPAYEEAYDALSSVSLPHFLTLASENINLPKKLYWYTIGIVNILFGLLIAVLLIMLVPGNGGSHVGGKRAWRLFAVPLSGLGGMQLYSAYKG